MSIRLIGALFLLLPGAAVPADDVAGYDVVDLGIPRPLTATPGDPTRGADIARDRAVGNCLSCHDLGGDDSFPGNVGPALSGVGARYTAAELRLRIVDPKVINAASMMPAFYRRTGLHRVMREFDGTTMLSGQQVEDVVAYLVTLK